MANSMANTMNTTEYRSWMADDSMRQALAAPGVMPKYFKALTEGQEETIEEGQPAIGYRLVYRRPDGKVAAPFFARLGSPEYAIGMLDQYEAALGMDIQGSLFTDLNKIQTTTLEGIHHSPTGIGWYCFLDRDMAEDYMRAFVYKTLEKYHFTDDMGSYQLFRVRGTTRKNVRGDEGFVLDDIMYDKEPLISIPLSVPYTATHP